MPNQDTLARILVELADTLVDDFDVVDLLTVLTDRCVEAFDIQAAGLMLAAPTGGALRVMASSSATMRDLELYEIQSSDGPCMECYGSGLPIFEQDLQTSLSRWPRFTPVALAAGIRSVSAAPMRLRGNVIGALNLFRSSDGTLGEEDFAAVQAFADVATIAILQNQAAIDARVVNTQLNYALNSRVVIEQAKGMLAERAGIEVDDAFNWLRGHARRSNLRLAVVAQGFLDGAVSAAMVHPPDRDPRPHGDAQT